MNFYYFNCMSICFGFFFAKSKLFLYFESEFLKSPLILTHSLINLRGFEKICEHVCNYHPQLRVKH